MRKLKMSSLNSTIRICFLIGFGIVALSQSGYGQPVFGTPFITNATCGYNNGTILAPVTGGTPPYSYTLNGTAQASNLFTGLPAGTYVIVVRDGSGATATTNVPLTNTGAHPIATATFTAPTGCDKTDGTITVRATGGVNPYTYSVGAGFTASNSFSRLSNGTYNVLVRGSNGCFGSVPVSLSANCASPGVRVVLTPACGAGTVTAIPLPGAIGRFSYSIDRTDYSNTSGTFTGVLPGTHKLYARDGAGNKFIYNFSLSQTCVITLPITTTSTAAVCANKNGTITITTSGGTAPYFYSVVGRPFQTSNVITGLGPGYYTVQTKDAAGHIGQKILVQVPGNCPTLNVTTTPTSCSANTGTITVVGTGAAPIRYSLAGPVNRPFQTGTTFNTLPAGDYTVTSSDANNNVITASATVSAVAGPSLDPVDVTPTGCTVDNGTAAAKATGGRAPFTYQVDNGATNTTGKFGALAAGVHNMKISDANGCSDIQTFTIVRADPPNLQLTAVPAGCTVGNGSIKAVADGGTGNYSYQLGVNPPNTTGLFPNLPGGTYTVTVTDGNGCSARQTATVGTAAGPNFPPAIIQPTSCSGDDGIVSSTATGGLAPYSYSLDDGNEETIGRFTDVAPGEHTFSVKDANGCVITQNITVGINNTLVVDAGAPANVCAGQSIKLNGSSNAPATWSPATGLTDPSVLNTAASPAGNTKYYLTAMSGVCTRIDSVIINVIDLPVADAGPDTTICYGDNARLNANGGISFTWTPSSFLDNDHTRSPVVLAPIQTMVYQLSVTDDNGCVSAKPDVVTVRVTPKAVVAAGKDTSVLAGIPFPLHASDVNGSGFSQYTWSPGTGLDNPNAQYPTANLSEGQTFIVTARTPAGCSAQDDITIKVFKEANLFVPNAFTPNNDGINDLLHVIPIGIKDFHYFRIYNRQGELVFNTADAGAGWDGRISGQIPSTGGYVWAAEGIGYDGRLMQRRGNVVLIR